MDNLNPQKFDEMPVLDLIKKIKDGLIDPKLVYKTTRQLCVETLFLEGAHVSQIADLFKVSDRTVRRDMVEIRQKNAVAPSPELTRALLGEFLTSSRHQSSSLRQIARIKDAFPDEKARAEYLAWKVGKELIDRLFQAGFLIGANEALPKEKKADWKIPYNTQKEKELADTIRALPPMEKEKLIERLRKDIHELSKQAEDARQGAVENGDQEIK